MQLIPLVWEATPFPLDGVVAETRLATYQVFAREGYGGYVEITTSTGRTEFIDCDNLEDGKQKAFGHYESTIYGLFQEFRVGQ